MLLGMAGEVDEREQVLLEQLRAGDSNACGVLAERYYEPLITFAWRLVGAHDLAEDVLQTVWLRLWRRREQLDTSQPLRAYLYTAVRHAAMDVQRSVRRTQSALEEAVVVWPTSVSETPLDTLAHDELVVLVEQAVQALPPRCRESWALVREQELSHADAAAIMGVSVNTVRVQMTKALALIRQYVTVHQGA